MLVLFLFRSFNTTTITCYMTVILMHTPLPIVATLLDQYSRTKRLLRNNVRTARHTIAHISCCFCHQRETGRFRIETNVFIMFYFPQQYHHACTTYWRY